MNDLATTAIYTLSLHDALPISRSPRKYICSSTSYWPSSFFVTQRIGRPSPDRKSTRLNSSHVEISYAVFCLKKKKNNGLPPHVTHTLRRASTDPSCRLPYHQPP